MAEPTEDGSLFREIDEELRQEHYLKVWKRYGNYVIAAALVIIVGVAGYKGWQGYSANKRAADGETFAAAVALAEERQDGAARDALAALARDGGAGYALLARFEAASLSARAGKAEEAAAAYRALAGDTAVPPTYRDLALILGTIQEMDGAAPTELGLRLAPLTADDAPWRHSARELTAVLAYQAGKADQARELYALLAGDATTPRGIQKRASEMLTLLEGK